LTISLGSAPTPDNILVCTLAVRTSLNEGAFPFGPGWAVKSMFSAGVYIYVGVKIVQLGDPATYTLITSGDIDIPGNNVASITEWNSSTGWDTGLIESDFMARYISSAVEGYFTSRKGDNLQIFATAVVDISGNTATYDYGFVSDVNESFGATNPVQLFVGYNANSPIGDIYPTAVWVDGGPMAYVNITLVPKATIPFARLEIRANTATEINSYYDGLFTTGFESAYPETGDLIVASITTNSPTPEPLAGFTTVGSITNGTTTHLLAYKLLTAPELGTFYYLDANATNITAHISVWHSPTGWDATTTVEDVATTPFGAPVTSITFGDVTSSSALNLVIASLGIEDVNLAESNIGEDWSNGYVTKINYGIYTHIHTIVQYF
jgi:hypothetical protein